MKRLVLVGALVGAFAASTAFAQTAEKSAAAKPTRKSGARMGQQGGHTAPKPQPPTEAATAPEGAMALGTVHIPKGVKADGKSLPAGTYQVRLTPQSAMPDAKGQASSLERWVELVKGGKVAGREVVTIVPQSEIDKVQKDAPPANNRSKVETLKGGDYLRVWIRKDGNHYLMHFPA